MKDKYIGKTVQIYAPTTFGGTGRPLDKGLVTDVIDENHIVMTIDGTDIETSYTLSDGIRVEIID